MRSCPRGRHSCHRLTPLHGRCQRRGGHRMMRHEGWQGMVGHECGRSTQRADDVKVHSCKQVRRFKLQRPCQQALGRVIVVIGHVQ